MTYLNLRLLIINQYKYSKNLLKEFNHHLVVYFKLLRFNRGHKILMFKVHSSKLIYLIHHQYSKALHNKTYLAPHNKDLHSKYNNPHNKYSNLHSKYNNPRNKYSSLHSKYNNPRNKSAFKILLHPNSLHLNLYSLISKPPNKPNKLPLNL